MRKITAVAVAVGICLIILLIGGFPQLGNAGEIYGCVLKGGYGLLRIVSNPSQCNRSETAISWNQVGPQGPKGDTGATGATGSQGTAGANGHSPIVSMSGDQITVDGVITGPHLTGPQGPSGPAGAGGVDGMSRAVMGRVNGDGSIWSGSEFQVIKNSDNGPGIYTIRFDTAFSTDPICVCTASAYGESLGGTLERYAVCGIDFVYPGIQDRRVVLRYPSDGSHIDGSFSFVCAEP